MFWSSLVLSGALLCSSTLLDVRSSAMHAPVRCASTSFTTGLALHVVLVRPRALVVIFQVYVPEFFNFFNSSGTTPSYSEYVS